MKKITILIIALALIGSVSRAQDTLYVLKNGAITTKIAVSQIDSIIFYQTTNIPTANAEIWEYDDLNDSWTKKTTFHVNKRENGVAFSVDQKGYFGTGYSVSGNPIVYYKDFYEYDVSTNKWTKLTDFAGGSRGMASGFSIGTTGYVGVGNVATNDFWAYNPSQNNWTQKANVGSVNRRTLAASFCIGNNGYICTGSTTYLKDILEYDPTTDSWTSKTDFPGVGRWGALGFAIGNKGYVGGGADANSTFPKDFYEYNPSNNTWTIKADLPVTFYCESSFVIGTKGYFIRKVSSQVYQYDQVTNTWTTKNNFQGNASCSYGFAIDEKGYLLIFPSTLKSASTLSDEDRLNRDKMIIDK